MVSIVVKEFIIKIISVHNQSQRLKYSHKNVRQGKRRRHPLGAFDVHNSVTSNFPLLGEVCNVKFQLDILQIIASNGEHTIRKFNDDEYSVSDKRQSNFRHLEKNYAFSQPSSHGIKSHCLNSCSFMSDISSSSAIILIISQDLFLSLNKVL